jgi:hypothetical protein
MVSTRSDLLDRLLSPVADCLTPESAQRLLDFQIDPATRSRIEQLASKANEGQLTDVEKGEYFDYVDAMDLIAILQHKAHQVLKRPTGQ